jgi:hypothetical protein
MTGQVLKVNGAFGKNILWQSLKSEKEQLHNDIYKSFLF